jgi:hypothetical protein
MYPRPPEASTSYTAHEQALGNGSLPGQELDVDLAAVRASISEVITFLKMFTRSDGRLANGIVSREALGSSLIIGFDPPAPWATATNYTTQSTVFQGFGFYLCVTPHTSGTFSTDLSSGRWVLLADLTPPGGALIADENLDDLPDKANARSNLGLGTMATSESGTATTQFRNNLENDARFQPLAANLTAWATLVGAADKLGYFTGTGAASLTDFTVFARSLLDDADSATMRATLDLVKQTSANDTTAGRLLLPGAFGLGGAVISAYSADADAIPHGGLFALASGAANSPDSARNWYVLHMQGSSSANAVQIAINRDPTFEGQIATRSKAASVWTAWGPINGNRGTVSGGNMAGLNSVDVSFNENARSFRMTLAGVTHPGSASTLYLRARQAGLGVVTTGVYDFANALIVNAASPTLSNLAAQTQIDLGGQANTVWNGAIYGHQRGALNEWSFTGTLRRTVAGGGMCKFVGGVTLGAPLNGMRLQLSSGNFASGDFTVDWGV